MNADPSDTVTRYGGTKPRVFAIYSSDIVVTG
jgi:hypothetical protein